MEFETELRERLRATAEGADVDLIELTDGSFRTGKRFVRRRVATVVAASACAGALVATVAWSGVLARPDREADYASTTSSAVTPAVEQVPITPQGALKTLLALLPSHGRYDNFKGGSLTGKPQLQGTGAVWVKLRHVDDAGPSNLSLAVGKMRIEPPCAPPSCERTVEPDGSVLVVKRDTGPDGKSKTWSATYTRSDGLQIYLLEDNSAVWKEAATRAEPPFSVKVLRQVVTSPKWQAKLDEPFVRASESLFDVERTR